MKSRQAIRALAGVLLCAVGLWLALPTPYRERTYIFNADGCRLETTVVEKQQGGSQGAVLLFHGISANKKIMSYLARGFAEQGLRVYVPDLPGHGRTPGPFSPARAEKCGEALLRELLARGMISANRTILAGHSMGGAIAERIAACVPVAGLIAISPAPMRAAHGLTGEKLLFSDPPELPSHSLVMVGWLEFESMRRNAADLVAARNNATTSYLEIRGATHVSILFSSAAMRSSQGWAAYVLNLPPTAALPSHRPLIGALAGFMGILLIAGPFLREVPGKDTGTEIAGTGTVIGVSRLFLEFAAGSVLSVLFLRFWIPLKAIGLFQGDYLASVSLLLGAMLVVMHWNDERFELSSSPRPILAAALAVNAPVLRSRASVAFRLFAGWVARAPWMGLPFFFVFFFSLLFSGANNAPAPQPREKRREHPP